METILPCPVCGKQPEFKKYTDSDLGLCCYAHCGVRVNSESELNFEWNKQVQIEINQKIQFKEEMAQRLERLKKSIVLAIGKGPNSVEIPLLVFGF